MASQAKNQRTLLAGGCSLWASSSGPADIDSCETAPLAMLPGIFHGEPRSTPAKPLEGGVDGRILGEYGLGRPEYKMADCRGEEGHDSA